MTSHREPRRSSRAATPASSGACGRPAGPPEAAAREGAAHNGAACHRKERTTAPPRSPYSKMAASTSRLRKGRTAEAALGGDEPTSRASPEPRPFVAFCAQHTQEHPEVMPYLASRHQKSSPEFLASVEFRNVLGRCLTRVQARRSKVYVYIKELCTVLKAHSQKKQQQQQQVSSAPLVEPPATPAGTSEQESHTPPRSRGSKRQIRYLENLLRVYAEEIRRLQAQELDLDELDNEDSAYLQESRLKRRMMRIFQRLCELKDCNSLTGRVIEQRIPYRGTRYPEVNRRIEHLINRPEAFPDYNDIFKVVQKASTRHSLGLPKQQMVSMATSAFQEVGERLQERRRLDLVYNFGSYLTDEYRRENDPALADDELARRLRRNRELAVQRLDQVLVHYVDLQDKEGEWRLGQVRPGSATSPQQEQPVMPRQLDSVVGAAARESGSGLRRTPGEASSPYHEEEDADEDEESSSSETDTEAELEKSLEDGGEEEEEEGLEPDPEDSPAREAEADQRMGLKSPELLLDSSPEEELEEEEEEEDDNDDDSSEEKEDQGQVGKQLSLPEPRPPDLSSPPSQQFLLEIEATLPLEASETPPPSPPLLPPSPPRLTEQRGGFPISLPKPQPPLKRSQSLENQGSCWPAPTASCRVNGQPPNKRSRQELSFSKSTCIEVPSGGSSEEEGDGEGLVSPLSPHSPVPMADSTCADSPSLSLVTSTQGSPQPGHLVHVYKGLGWYVVPSTTAPPAPPVDIGAPQFPPSICQCLPSL